ncbi:cytidine deaminase-like [Octopus vulgaris]|uniref:Cytidine deaminase n=1 Tax=Octopus vulgaris TaxID=6645 RepID=A0AA36BAJ2_OCTVU|nr:cytidine deaminase-like [Octopus vulgaris]
MARPTEPGPCTAVNEHVKSLIQAAAEAKEKAYCPYSNFRVGAALLTEDDSIITGCNVENCTYGGTICAERTAMVKAVSEGKKSFKAIAVASDKKDKIAPCGICRQFMAEFGTDWDVYLTSNDGSFEKMTVSQLLPLAFQPSHLK